MNEAENSGELMRDGMLEAMEGSRLNRQGLAGFSLIEGELPIATALELAVLTFVHHRYRDVSQWRVQQIYSFTLAGIFQRTYVEAWGTAEPIRFTPEEAIMIAGQLSQQDCWDW
jgi:hypothetical protein